MSSTWIKAAPLTSCEGRIVLPTGVDKHHYIALSDDCIWKYNVDEDAWSKLMDLSIVTKGWYFGDDTAAALSQDKSDLYIYNCIGGSRGSKLLHIKLQDKITIFDSNYYSGTLTKLVMIDNKLNIIGGWSSNKHMKWNEQIKQFEGDIIMHNKAKISGFGLICINKSKKELLLFGGYDYDNNQYLAHGLEFDFKTTQWNKLSIELPNKIWRVSCTLAIRNQFIFILSGYGVLYNYNRGEGYSNDIYIYNVRNKTIRTSEIKLPHRPEAQTIFKCITINDELRDEMITFGFVRNAWTAAEIDDHYFPPHYILKIMHSYYLNEYIYLLDDDSGEHWKMNTLDIL